MLQHPTSGGKRERKMQKKKKKKKRPHHHYPLGCLSIKNWYLFEVILSEIPVWLRLLWKLLFTCIKLQQFSKKSVFIQLFTLKNRFLETGEEAACDHMEFSDHHSFPLEVPIYLSFANANQSDSIILSKAIKVYNAFGGHYTGEMNTFPPRSPFCFTPPRKIEKKTQHYTFVLELE